MKNWNNTKKPTIKERKLRGIILFPIPVYNLYYIT